MVDVLIKGTGKRSSNNPTFEIAIIKAGVVLKDKGGIIITVSDQYLSMKLKQFFEKFESEDND